MHGTRGQRSGKQQTFGHNLLLTVACPDDDMSHAYTNRASHLFSQPKPKKKISDFEISPDPWIPNGRVRPRMFDDDDDELPCSINFQQTRRGARTTSSSSSQSCRRKLIYRSFQVFSFLIIGISLYALVENIKYLIRTYDGEDELSRENDRRFVNINEELQSWVVQEKSSIPSTLSHQKTLPPDLKKSVLNLQSLSFNLNNVSVCKSKTNNSLLGKGIYFMIIVHSAPENFEARQSIRSTWGSVKSLKNVTFRLIFLMGSTGEWVENSDLVDASITRESELFGDIVTASFVDSYKNLTYKHLSGYKWAQEFCPFATFILKCDDDAFIDVFQLFEFITRTYGFKPSAGTLICNVFPEGSKPVRASDSEGTKWAVSPEEYPHAIYPKYCGGLAYLVTPDVIQRILSVSDKVRFFWIDDVFVTGILRELAGIEPFYLNLRYSYDPERYRKWLTILPHSPYKVNNGTASNLIQANSKLSKFPFMVTHVERGSKLSQEMSQLWRKTLRAWSDEHGANVITFR